MDLRQLEIFLAVIDTSSVTGAAMRMNLSPGAVSLQMQNLAASLHTELFVRAGKHLKPTSAAHRLADMSRVLITQAHAIEHEFDAQTGDDTRAFHLATGATSLIHRLGQPLRQLRKRFPRAKLNITVAATEEMITGLIQRRFDLAIISLPLPSEQPGLRIIPLYDEELLVLRPSTTRVKGWHVGTVQPDDLKSLPFILYPKRSNMRTMIDGMFRRADFEPEITMEADDTETIKGLVSAGLGYSVLPEFALRRQPRFFHVSRIAGQKLVRKQALAMPRNDYTRPLAESIARYLTEVLKG
jgi:DNA-binding transcriptional LysR family regulator